MRSSRRNRALTVGLSTIFVGCAAFNANAQATHESTTPSNANDKIVPKPDLSIISQPPETVTLHVDPNDAQAFREHLINGGITDFTEGELELGMIPFSFTQENFREAISVLAQMPPGLRVLVVGGT